VLDLIKVLDLMQLLLQYCALLSADGGQCFSVWMEQAFGQEASKVLPYVECYPEGYRRGVKIAQASEDAKIEGFPTWVINGEVR